MSKKCSLHTAKTPIRLMLIAITALSFSLSNSAFAQQPVAKEKSFIEKYLYWLVPEKNHEGEDPSATLQAPFAHGEIKSNNSELAKIYEEARLLEKGENINELHVPHRSHEQIEEWIADAIGKSLNFELKDMKNFGRTVKPYYSDNGLETFKRFLMGINAVSVMQTSNKKLSSYITQLPTLRKEGNEQGVYVWIYDVPVRISYMDNTNQQKKAEPINQGYILRLKIMKTPNTKLYQEGIFIHILSAKKSKANS